MVYHNLICMVWDTIINMKTIISKRIGEQRLIRDDLLLDIDDAVEEIFQ